MKPRTVICPHCGAASAWNNANPWRPFCSERCKMIDLGAWATESYRIPVVEHDDIVDGENTGDDTTLN